MTRWLLLIFLAGLANTLPREQLSIVLQNFGDFRREETSENVLANATETTLCDSEVCQNIATYITGNMDKSVDPCHNFYQFACGKFPENNPIPPYMPSWSTWTIVRNNINRHLRNLLESNIEKHDLLPVKFAKKWYRSCMDEEKTEKLGLEPLEALMQRIGGWPITMDDYEWNEDIYPWYRVERYFLKLSGIVSLFDFDVAISGRFHGEEKYVLSIGPPVLPLWEQLMPLVHRELLYDGDYYENLIVEVATEIAKLRRATVSKETIVKDAKDIIDFEKQLYRIIFRRNTDRELLPEKKWINWNREKRDDDDDDSDIGSGGGSGNGSGHGSGDGDDDGTSDDDNGSGDVDEDRENPTNAEASMEVRIKFQKAVEGILNDLLREKNNNVSVFWESVGVRSSLIPLVDLTQRTPMRTIVNYIHWNFISNLLKYTTVDMKKLLFEVVKRYRGIPDIAPRWESCIMNIKMNDILSYMFVKKYFTDDVKDTAKEMITAIQKQINNQISECEWLDNNTKEALTKKLNNMASLVGYPSWYDNTTRVANYYKGLIIGHGLLDNVLSYTKFKKLQHLNARDTWDMSSNDMWRIDPLTVTGVYFAMMNTFIIPAADFQQPFFSLSQPDYINFGTVGSVIGHEIMHAFDPNVRAFDQTVQWPRDTEKEYIKREQCFVEQYNKYSIKMPGTDQTITIDGLKTLGENVADSGMQAQYRAFRQWTLEKRKPHVALPGLEEYTDDQLFFLALGNVWCEAMRPVYLKIRMKTDVHSMRPLRLIGMLSNSEEFSRAFKCPPGSPMNPTTKCNIWK